MTPPKAIAVSVNIPVGHGTWVDRHKVRVVFLDVDQFAQAYKSGAPK